MFDRLLKEPLAIFCVAAAGIFVVDAIRNGGETTESLAEADQNAVSTIIVNEAVVDILQEDFEWLEGREPNEEETEQIVQEWLNEEIVFREALRQNMHLSDGKMRAHLIEKVRLLWAGVPSTPSEEDLLAFYMDNIQEYYSETRVSFDQVFYSEQPENADELLERLRAGEDIEGERYWLGDNMSDYAASILRSSFGGEFFTALLEAPLETWMGPYQSPRGYHYVKVSGVQQPQPIAYEAVRDRLLQDWSDAMLFNRVAERTEQIRDEFDVVYDSSGEVSSSVEALLASARNLREEEGH